MKRFLALVVILCTATTTFARTCPPTSQLFQKMSGGGYELRVPSGWTLVENTRESKYEEFTFRVAAWGDHKHPTDNVRCYYYDNYEGMHHVKLETNELMPAENVKAWGGNDPLYYLCVSRSNNVGECSFV